MTTCARSSKELLDASRQFASENRLRSWWALLSTTALLVIVEVAIVRFDTWALRLPLMLLASLTIIREFTIVHDYYHGAILRRSLAARIILYPFSVLLMTPPSIWRQTHNYHHAHTAKLVGSHVGSYVMVTPQLWAKMGSRERFMYRAIRHPLTIAGGYFTVFMLGMCISPFLRSPRRNWQAAFTLIVNWLVTAVLIAKFGFTIFFVTFFAPLSFAMAVGAYLFYAQHNFPDVHIQPRESWSFSRAATESSSFMRMGPMMSYFTGNIGYHHVHHLNSQIPFYRLPEAMAAIEELHDPPTTSLSPTSIAACFRLKLWCPERNRMIGFHEIAT